jgi:hypothetical protein
VVEDGVFTARFLCATPVNREPKVPAPLLYEEWV